MQLTKKAKKRCTVRELASVWHHRWCSGVTKQRFETISASPEPFFCPSCKSERQQDAIVRMKLCVDSLCEVRVLKGTVETLLKQTPAPVLLQKMSVTKMVQNGTLLGRKNQPERKDSMQILVNIPLCTVKNWEFT